MQAQGLPATRVRGTVLHRQPVVHPDRSVFGYAVRAVVTGPDGLPEPENRVEHLLDAQYRVLDPAMVAGERPLVVRATTRIYLGQAILAETKNPVIVEVPWSLAKREGAADQLIALKKRGFSTALGDYTGDKAQDILVPYVDYVKIDIAIGDTFGGLAGFVRDMGGTVIAERADTHERIQFAMAKGAELLQGPMFERRRSNQGRQMSAGEMQCLELVRLLSGEYPDQDAVTRVVGSDPELAMRVLHLVNNSATGVRRHIDSVRQAVVLVGPRQLGALAMASLVDARVTAVGPLWSVLTRAITCARLTSSDAGYTVGMLSAITSQLDLSIDWVVERSGVSDAIAGALREQSGPLGHMLAAVLAHEENDTQAVRAAGFEPFEVAHTHLAAIPEALALATALATPGAA